MGKPNTYQTPGKHCNSWLDLFRASAALLVCVGHIRNIFWVDYGEVQAKAWWHLPAYVATGFGHQAVIIFFVLSGFLVGGGVLAKAKSFSWTDYCSARLVRLWLVLLPALVFTAACDAVTLRALPSAFDGTLSHLWNSGPTSTRGISWPVFVANGLFLQTIVVPVFGSNGPLWSLANEFWYYLLFPLIAYGLNVIGAGGSRSRAVVLLLVLGIAFWLPREITCYFSIWLLGVACASFLRDFEGAIGKRFTILAFVVFIGAVVASKVFTSSWWFQLFADVLLGLGFSLLLVCLQGLRAPWKTHGFLSAMIKRTADFSYSLYLFHFPLITLLGVTTVAAAQLQPSVGSLAALLGATALCMTIAWMSWLLFERHNDQIRGAVRRLIVWLGKRDSRVNQAWSAE